MFSCSADKVDQTFDSTPGKTASERVTNPCKHFELNNFTLIAQKSRQSKPKHNTWHACKFRWCPLRSFSFMAPKQFAHNCPRKRLDSHGPRHTIHNNPFTFSPIFVTVNDRKITKFRRENHPSSTHHLGNYSQKDGFRAGSRWAATTTATRDSRLSEYPRLVRCESGGWMRSMVILKWTRSDLVVSVCCCFLLSKVPHNTNKYLKVIDIVVN